MTAYLTVVGLELGWWHHWRSHMQTITHSNHNRMICRQTLAGLYTHTHTPECHQPSLNSWPFEEWSVVTKPAHSKYILVIQFNGGPPSPTCWPLTCRLALFSATRVGESAWPGYDHPVSSRCHQCSQCAQWDQSVAVIYLVQCHVRPEWAKPAPIECTPLLTQPIELWNDTHESW